MPTLEGMPRWSLASPSVADTQPAPQPESGQPDQTYRRSRRKASVGARGADDFLLRLYWRDVSNQPPFAPGEESEMAWRASFADEPGRERLVLGNLGRVLEIAEEYQGLGLPLSDLISEGNLGLMHATRLFKPTEGVPFQAYAAVWIRQQMRRALTRQAWPLRLPAAFSWQQGRLREAELRLSNRAGRAPADEELAAESGLTLGTVRRLRANGFPRQLSLQSPVAGSDDGEVLADTIPDERMAPPDVVASRRSDREYVGGLLASLRPREREVLRLRFGLEDGEQRTLEEVGSVLGYVRQGVHKIESAALARLRRRAGTAA